MSSLTSLDENIFADAMEKNNLDRELIMETPPSSPSRDEKKDEKPGLVTWS